MGVQQMLLLMSVVGMVLRSLWRELRTRIVKQYCHADQALSAKDDDASQSLISITELSNTLRPVKIKTLDSRFLPLGSPSSIRQAPLGRRLIFIGDIHGCIDELQDLLQKCRYERETDHLIALGDVVNKGPESHKVLDFLMTEAASCVRGNHDDKILRLAVQYLHDIQNSRNRHAESMSKHKDLKARNLARSLTREHLAWLQTCPLILRVGNLQKFGEVVAVHAGLVAGLPIDAQHPDAVMNMRSINLLSHKPSSEHAKAGSVPWYDFWNAYQTTMKALHSSPLGVYLGLTSFCPTTVVYGHDAKSGLQIHEFTKGLDSGCASGRQLTAWIVADYGQTKLVQVPCGSRIGQNKG